MANWKVEGLYVAQVDGHDSVVVSVHWALGPLKNETRLSRPSADFIPFPQLTEAVVLGWVWDKVNKAAWEERAEQAGKMAGVPTSDAVSVALPWSN